MRNIAASVRAKLTKIAREEGLVLDFMIERFAIYKKSLTPKKSSRTKS